jgi:hypothetical protein
LRIGESFNEWLIRLFYRQRVRTNSALIKFASYELGCCRCKLIIPSAQSEYLLTRSIQSKGHPAGPSRLTVERDVIFPREAFRADVTCEA